MNQLNAYDTVPSMPDHAGAEDTQGYGALDFGLKRVGKRPLVFQGSELCMAMNFAPAAPYWYEINLYRTTNHQFVAGIKLFFRSEDEKDISRAWECATFAEAVDRLETFDPAVDVRIDVAADAKLSPPELAAHAFALRAKVEEARRCYANLVGELLYDLDQG